MNELVQIDKKQLTEYNAKLKELQAKIDYYDSLPDLPSTNEEWLRSTGTFEKRSITYKSDSSVMPWIVLLAGIGFALWLLKH